MAEGTHRCAVDGCPNLAAYDVMLYSFDPIEGAVVIAGDDACPYLCVEHALDNEREARGERLLDAFVEYPYTNQSRRAGITIYIQQMPAYVA